MKKLITLSFLCLVFTNMSIAQIIGLKFGDSYATCKKILDDEYNNGVVSNQSLEKGDTVLTYENIKFEGKLYDKLQCVFFPQDNNLLLASISFSNTYSFDQKSIMRTTFNKWYNEYNEKYSFITELSQNESDIYMYEDSIHNSYIMITLATNDSLKEYTCGITYASMELMNNMLMSAMGSSPDVQSEEYQIAINCTMEIADVKFGWSYEKCKAILDQKFNDGKSSEQNNPESLTYSGVYIGDSYYQLLIFNFKQHGQIYYLSSVIFNNMLPISNKGSMTTVFNHTVELYKKQYMFIKQYVSNDGSDMFVFIDNEANCGIMGSLSQTTLNDDDYESFSIYFTPMDESTKNDLIEQRVSVQASALRDINIGGVELGWSYDKCKPILDKRFNGGEKSYPPYDKRGKQLEYSQIYFGGQYYDNIDFRFKNDSQDSYLSEVILTKGWELTESYQANSTLSEVADLYAQKYPLLRKTKNKDGFDDYSFMAAGESNYITVTVIKGESQGGKMRLYLWVMYGSLQQKNSPLDEI